MQQVLFYPVTDANFDTASYHQFAEGYFLRRDAMQWFWDQYTTDQDAARRDHRLAAARDAPSSCAGLPPALVITGEADVLRDEGEAYATSCARPASRSPPSRYQGIIHDFVMLNALRDTHAAKAAIAQAIRFISERLA